MNKSLSIILFFLLLSHYAFPVVLFVETLSGKTIMVQLEEEDPKILDVKLKIEELENFLPEQQNLIYNGVFLDNRKRLSYYEIGHQATLHLITQVTTVWTGLFSAEWEFEPNWSVNVPDLASDVIVADVSMEGMPSPVISTSVNCKDLFIEQGANLKIDEDGILSIYGKLTNEGNLEAIGEIKAILELNNIKLLNVSDLGAQISTKVNMGNTIITRGGTSHLIDNRESISRYYEIYPAINENLNATLVFNYSDSELNSNEENKLQIFSSTDGGLTWMPLGGEVNTKKNTITLKEIQSFALYTASSYKNEGKLPIFIAAGTGGLLIIGVIVFILIRIIRKKRKNN